MMWAVSGGGMGTKPHLFGAGGVRTQVQVRQPGDAIQVGVAEQ